MTTRLHCRDCDWHPTFRRKRTATALRAAARHRCTSTPDIHTTTSWWTRLWTRRTTNSAVALPETTTAGEFHDRHGNRIQSAVLAAHHADTTRLARQAMVDLVRAGYHLGPPPYGYRALRIRITAPAGHSKLRAVLVPDWRTAAVVTQIFTWRAVNGMTFAAIAILLNKNRGTYPPPGDTWTARTVRRIVTNPVYTGREVWGRTVAGRPVPVDQWITSASTAHEPLVDDRTFQRAQGRPHVADNEQRLDRVS